MASCNPNDVNLCGLSRNSSKTQNRQADTRDLRKQCITNFPTEIWSSIAEFMSGEDLGRLKSTGNKRLWVLLSVKTVVSSVTFDFLRLKTWPSYLNELPSINTLVIEYPVGSMMLGDGFKLSMLPQTLTILNLHKSDSLSVFPKAGWSLSDHLPNLTELSLLDEWLPHWSGGYPRLTSLTVLQYYSSIPLPPNLTRLRVLVYLHILDQVVPFPALEHLEMESSSLTLLAPLLSDLPLKTIKATWKFSFASGAIQQLPGTLTKFGDLDYSTVPPSGRNGLPDYSFRKFTCLTSLCAKMLPVKEWCCLPQTLTYLKLEAISPLEAATDNQVQTYSIEKLPQSIITLHLEFKSIDPPKIDFSDFASHSESTIRLFPPRMTHFELFGAYLSINAAQQLPKSLTALHFPNLTSSICAYISRGLKTLHCYKASMTPELIVLLPSSLTDLELNFGMMGSNCIRNVTPEQALLEKTWEEQSKLLWQGDYCLPPQLQSLTIKMYPFIDDRFFHSDKLRYLQKLTLGGDRLSNKSIQLLPRFLVHFSTEHSPGVTGKCFVDLPRSLTFLNLGSKIILDSDIEFLPRMLKTLKLRFTDQLTDLGIKYLPRSIETLDVSYCSQITPNCFQDLPIKIRYSTTYFREWEIQNGAIIEKLKNPVQKLVDSVKTWLKRKFV